MDFSELVITRILDAPLDAAWDAWTIPWQVQNWWGPTGYTSPRCSLDVRAGGKYHICMRSLEGKDMWSTGMYIEMVEPSRLVMTDSFADEEGNVVDATYYGMEPGIPLELLVTVTFEDIDGRTKMVVRHSGFVKEDIKLRADMRKGWNEMFDKLESFLIASARTEIIAKPGTKEIKTVRMFDAPIEAVFLALTDPGWFPMWCGSRHMRTTIIEHDFRSGGTWHYIQVGDDGKEHGFKGAFLEIDVPKAVVRTFEVEGMPGQVATETTTFDAMEGKTLVTTRSTYHSVNDRDGVLASGAGERMIESYYRLDELLIAGAFPDLGTITCTALGCHVLT